MYLARSLLLALLLTGAAVAQAAPDAAGSERRTPTEDEQLSLAALEGLMAQPAERALPILKKVLAGPQTPLVKRRALFVLGQIDSQEARDLLLQTAKSSPELRGEAIRSIGIGGDAKTLDALSEIYKTGDAEVKKDILQAWMIAGRKQAVYDVAVNAKTEDEASEAIRMLGVMGATEELRKLGDRPTQPRGLLEAYAIAGDLEGLLKIVNGPGDRAMRVDAVRRIGIIGRDDARKALREIYAKSTDAEMREAALQGMLISQDEEGVLALYRAAKTADEKRSLLRMLTLMGGDVALQAIDAQLEKK